MPPVGFEPTISAGERPQTYALDRAATGTGSSPVLRYLNPGGWACGACSTHERNVRHIQTSIRKTWRKETQTRQRFRLKNNIKINLQQITCNGMEWMLRLRIFWLIRRFKWVCGTRWRSWWRHCATSQKVAVSVLDAAIGIFHWHNPSGRTMALGLTQPLTEMSTRNISWGVKGAGA